MPQCCTAAPTRVRRVGETCAGTSPFPQDSLSRFLSRHGCKYGSGSGPVHGTMSLSRRDMFTPARGKGADETGGLECPDGW